METIHINKTLGIDRFPMWLSGWKLNFNAIVNTTIYEFIVFSTQQKSPRMWHVVIQYSGYTSQFPVLPRLLVVDDDDEVAHMNRVVRSVFLSL